jgi:hypothetical protein
MIEWLGLYVVIELIRTRDLSAWDKFISENQKRRLKQSNRFDISGSISANV